MVVWLVRESVTAPGILQKLQVRLERAVTCVLYDDGEMIVWLFVMDLRLMEGENRVS